MDGELSVESELGKGSSFTICLKNVQIRDNCSNQISEINFKPEKVKFKKSKLLIVEDDENNRNYIISALKNTLIDVSVSENGKEALLEIKKVLPNLIITDLKMPVMDGFKFFNKIKKEGIKNLPVVATSASPTRLIMERVKKNEFNGFLSKPFKLIDLYLELMKFLPYEISPGKAENIENKSDFSQTANEKETLPEIIEILEGKLMDIWKPLQTNLSMNKIEKFSSEIFQILEIYNCKPLEQYVMDLKTAIDSFDINHMTVKLEKFPELILKLKTTSVSPD